MVEQKLTTIWKMKEIGEKQHKARVNSEANHGWPVSLQPSAYIVT
jgi:hypothetical protein